MLQAALDLIERQVPGGSNQFLLEEHPSDDGKNFYEIFRKEDKICLRGDCTVSLCMAFYRYLKEYCSVNLSWCGNRQLEVTEFPRPEKKLEGKIDQKYRVYMNYCTLCYSALPWDWARWEKEIDFMAMNGVNMPLSVIGMEAVWFETLLEFGFSRKEALSFLSGPGFWAWQMMTNLEGFLPPPDESYLEQRLELGRKILDRERELGMTPIQQGFSGQVPKEMAKKFPQAHIVKTASWCGFPVTFQLDPLDPLFQSLGRSLLEHQKKMLGCGHLFACDPFHENQPPSKAWGYLPKVGKAINRLYQSFDPDSIWVMQAWSIRGAIARAVPKGRLLVLDLNSEQYKRFHGFWGHDFVLGDLHNFGGKNSLHGDVAFRASNPYAVEKKRYPHLLGTGLFMEGINQNPLYYDLDFTMMTQSDSMNLPSWLNDYGRRRYHSQEPCLSKALELLTKSCYAPGTSDSERGSVFCARPSFFLTCAAPNDRIELRYENRILYEAVENLLQSEAPPTDGYLFDACDWTRQLLSNYGLFLYQKFSQAFFMRDRETFMRLSQDFLILMKEVDALLSTRMELTLSHWTDRVQALGTTPALKAYYLKNALCLITLWGPIEKPQIFDYAWREWGGLLLEFYLPRWKLFLEDALEHFDTLPRQESKEIERAYDRPAFDATPLLQKMAQQERRFLDSECVVSSPTEDTLTLVKRLLKKYQQELQADYPSVQKRKKANLNFWKHA